MQFGVKRTRGFPWESAEDEQAMFEALRVSAHVWNAWHKWLRQLAAQYPGPEQKPPHLVLAKQHSCGDLLTKETSGVVPEHAAVAQMVTRMN